MNLFGEKHDWHRLHEVDRIVHIERAHGQIIQVTFQRGRTYQCSMCPKTKWEGKWISAPDAQFSDSQDTYELSAKDPALTVEVLTAKEINHGTPKCTLHPLREKVKTVKIPTLINDVVVELCAECWKELETNGTYNKKPLVLKTYWVQED